MQLLRTCSRLSLTIRVSPTSLGITIRVSPIVSALGVEFPTLTTIEFSTVFGTPTFVPRGTFRVSINAVAPMQARYGLFPADREVGRSMR
jgi:hypothetical protein